MKRYHTKRSSNTLNEARTHTKTHLDFSCSFKTVDKLYCCHETNQPSPSADKPTALRTDVKNNIVAKSNDLIVASYLMTRHEQNLLLACMSKIDSRPDANNLTIDDEFVINIKDVKAFFYDPKTERNAYRDLKKASDNLFDREVMIALPDNKTLRTRFISGIVFDPDCGKITLTFAQKILPYLTQLKRNFTTYRLADTVELSSVHAVRLYELMVCWSGQNRWAETIDIEDFKYMMGIEGKYTQFSNLRDRVIETAITQINENTSYNISVSYRKVAREHRSMTFKFYKKDAIKLTEDGALSVDKIYRIVRTDQFVADYNNHPMLSGEAKRSNEKFWEECEVLLASHPKEFTKRPFNDYLKKPQKALAA